MRFLWPRRFFPSWRGQKYKENGSGKEKSVFFVKMLRGWGKTEAAAKETLGGSFNATVFLPYLVLPGYTFKASSRHLMAAFRSSMQMQ